MIEEGSLSFRQTLPSTRILANQLGLNRSTVCRAYEELQALGYLSSRRGSYHHVLKKRRETFPSAGQAPSLAWETLVGGKTRTILAEYLAFKPEKTLSPDIKIHVNLARLDPDPRLFPLQNVRRCASNILHSEENRPLGYGEPKGYPPLRRQIAKRMRLHGISATEEDILITNGAQQALDLIFRVLGGNHKRIAVEIPSYAQIFPLLRFHGFEPVPVPVRFNGMDLDCLNHALKEGVRIVYTMPNFQNPTGITTDTGHREKLLNICARHGALIIEDGFEEDMKYFGKVPLPIKSMDDRNSVCYIGTFSKALFPGLRIGWIHADFAFINYMTALRRFADLGSSRFLQLLLSDFLEKGYYDLHLRRLHRAYRSRLDLALQTLERTFPSSVRWTKPAGGYTFWLTFPRKIDQKEFAELTKLSGVLTSFGAYFYPRFESSAHARVSIAASVEEEIEDGLTRLGKTLHNYF